MSAAASAITRREIETRLIEKAWKDPVFRKEVVSDAKTLLEKQTGQKLPEQMKIYVHEEDANTLHFSIPPVPSNIAELSDEDLEKVAGGTDLVLTLMFAGLGALGGVVGAGSAVGTVAAVTKTQGNW